MMVRTAAQKPYTASNSVGQSECKMVKSVTPCCDSMPPVRVGKGMPSKGLFWFCTVATHDEQKRKVSHDDTCRGMP